MTLPERSNVLRLLAAISFLFAISIFAITYLGTNGGTMLVIAAVIGGYMAMNIGANDVANNVGPAVGSKALTMGGAIIIAAIFETSGALVAGGDVVSTIKKSNHPKFGIFKVHVNPAEIMGHTTEPEHSTATIPPVVQTGKPFRLKNARFFRKLRFVEIHNVADRRGQP